MSTVNSNGNLRDEIRATTRKGESLEVEEWGRNGVTLELRSMNVGEKYDLFGDTDPENMKVSDLGDMVPKVVIATCFDPKTGERVFADEDEEWLAKEPANVLEPVAEAGMRVSGMTQETAEAGKDESSSTTSSATATSEPSA